MLSILCESIITNQLAVYRASISRCWLKNARNQSLFKDKTGTPLNLL